MVYDPTNGMFVGTGRIALTRGRGYGEVTPARGVVRQLAAGRQTSSQALRVVLPDWGATAVAAEQALIGARCATWEPAAAVLHCHGRAVCA